MMINMLINNLLELYLNYLIISCYHLINFLTFNFHFPFIQPIDT
jgi:hypothetical protein